MQKSGVDPNRHWSAGIPATIAGESLFEAPTLATGARQLYPKGIDGEAIDVLWRVKEQPIVDALTEQELTRLNEKYGNLDDLDANQLKNLIETEELDIGKIVSGEKPVSIAQKIKDTVAANNLQKRVDQYINEDILPNLNKLQIEMEEKAVIDSFTSKQLDTYLMEEFGSQEAYKQWAALQGEYAFDPTLRETDADTFVLEKLALARAKTNLRIREKTKGIISQYGKKNYNKHIDQVSKKYSIEDLKQQILKHNITGMNQQNVNKLSKSALANILVEYEAVISMQNQRAKAGATKIVEVPSDINQDNIEEAVRVNGLALKAWLDIPVAEDKPPITVLFVRKGLDADASAAQQIENKGAELTVFSVKNGNLEDFEGKTIDEVRTEGDRISKLELQHGALPQLHEGAASKILGLWAKYFRPLTLVGIAGNRFRQMRGRIKSMDSFAQFMGLEVERAILRAELNKEIANKDEGDRLLMAYWKQTGAPIKYTEEEKSAAKNYIQTLEKQKDDPSENVHEIQQEIDAENIKIDEGYQTEKVALRQLPPSLQKVAAEVRAGIDGLSQRILNEMPKGTLTEETREKIESLLGQYITRSFAIFEPALGFYPQGALRLDSIIKKAPHMRALYNKAIIAIEANNRKTLLPAYIFDAEKELRNTSYDSVEARDEAIQKEAEKKLNEFAKQEIEDIFSEDMFQNANDVQNIAGILAPAKKSKKPVSKVAQMLGSRKTIPLAVRKLMGEIKDPKLVAATSFSRIAKLVEMATLFNDLKDINQLPGEMMFSPVPFGPFQTPIEAGDEFNPLDGYFTTPEMAELLGRPEKDTSLTGKSLSAFITVFGGSRALVQYGMIVLSPGTQMRNIYGAALMYGFNGHFGPGEGNLKQTTDLVINELFGGFTTNAQTGEVTVGNADIERTWRKLQQLGIVNSEVRTNDIIGVFQKIKSGSFLNMDQLVRTLYAIGQTSVGKPLNTYGPFAWNRGAKRAYGASDDFFKILAFYAERTKLLEAVNIEGLTNENKVEILDDFAKTLGTNIGDYHQDQSTVLRNVTDLDKYADNLAAYMVRNTMPNYDYIGKFAEFVRLIPFGNFIAFPTEILRTSANALNITQKLLYYKVSPELSARLNLPLEEKVIRDFDGNPQVVQRGLSPFKSMAFKRMVGGFEAGFGIVQQMKFIGQAVFNVDDEELEAAALVGSPWATGENVIPASEVDHSGEGTGLDTINANYVFPYELLSKMYVRLLREYRKDEYGLTGGIPDAVWDDVLKEVILGISDSYTDKAISAEIIQDIMLNMNVRTKKEIWGAGDTWQEKAVRYVLKNGGPGIYRQVNDVIWSLQEGDARFDRYGRTIEFATAAAKVMGMSSGRVNPTQSMPYVIGTTKKIIRTSILPQLQKANIASGVVTEREIIRDVLDAQGQWFEEQQNLFFVLEHYKKLDINEKVYKDQINLLIKQSGVDRKFKQNIENGVFTPFVIPPSIKKNFNARSKKDGLDRTWPTEIIKNIDRAYKHFSLTKNSSLPRNYLSISDEAYE